MRTKPVYEKANITEEYGKQTVLTSAKTNDVFLQKYFGEKYLESI